MGKKNIQPTTSSPVSRTLVVAPRPTQKLRAEPQEGHISSLTGPDPSYIDITIRLKHEQTPAETPRTKTPDYEPEGTSSWNIWGLE